MRIASFNKVNNLMDVMTRGEKVCAFIKAYCKILEGAQAAQPIKLVKFQKQSVVSTKRAFGLLIAISYVLLLVTA